MPAIVVCESLKERLKEVFQRPIIDDNAEEVFVNLGDLYRIVKNLYMDRYTIYNNSTRTRDTVYF
jgi:hypothetical protein